MKTEQTRSKRERSVRIPLLAAAGLVEKIDDWSFANRVRSRSEAIRQLVAIGLGTPNENGPATAVTVPDLEHDLSR